MSMEAVTRTAVVLDQYPLWLDAVEPVLEHAGLAVVGKATAAHHALILVGRHEPDAMVVGAFEHDGVEQCPDYIQRVKPRAPAPRLLGRGAAPPRDEICAAFRAGAHSYIVKTARPDDISAGIRQVFETSVFFAASFDFRAASAGGSDGDELSRPGLTRRESEILRLVARGHSNGRMARMLWVTEPTVKFHLSNIYRKLDVANRTEASRWAHVNGLLEEDEAEEGEVLASPAAAA
jgi:DNA-binding NarL/FixJ family response regulator